MRNNWLFFMDVDAGSSPYMFSGDPLVPLRFGFPLLSQINSLVESSVHNSRNLSVLGTVALQEAFSFFSNFTGALLVWFTSGSNTNINRNLPGNSQALKTKNSRSPVTKHIASVKHNIFGISLSSRSKQKCTMPFLLGKIPCFTARHLTGVARELQSLPMLSLAAALIPPFRNSPTGALGFQAENTDNRTQRCIHESAGGLEYGGCSDLPFHNLNWTRHAVEPRTGIEFPVLLDNVVAGETNSSLTSEVLVGTGSRIMTVIKVKSLKIYAFGFYVHPFDVCVKLGQKYASIPIGEVNKCDDFYRDLLREDINMSVRLVVNYSGMKISTVRDAFEKSLRARLVKTNPDTDYDCLNAFGSLFAKDIPLQVGTTIDFRRTTDGRLITEIEGNHIGAVHSKDLCRAFFDMYIGEGPVSEKTKEEIGKNVASILRRC